MKKRKQKLKKLLLHLNNNIKAQTDKLKDTFAYEPTFSLSVGEFTISVNDPTRWYK